MGNSASIIIRPISGYNGLYEIDMNGNIYSCKRIIKRHASIRNGVPFPETEIIKERKLLRPCHLRNGYLYVDLYNIEHRRKRYLVHRLVAETFIVNPYGYNVVNHKNEDKTDNRVENLEWCTSEYNLAYSMEKTKSICREKLSKSVNAYTKEGVFIGLFHSLTDASNHTGVDIRNISKCIHGERKISKGYMFSFNN